VRREGTYNANISPIIVSEYTYLSRGKFTVPTEQRRPTPQSPMEDDTRSHV